jgi:hypothetical protein
MRHADGLEHIQSDSTWARRFARTTKVFVGVPRGDRYRPPPRGFFPPYF